MTDALFTARPSSETARSIRFPLAIHDVSHGFAAPDGTHTPILDRINLSIARGEILAIVGRSGAGKSTLFNLISGLLTPQSGRIEVAPHTDGRPGQVGYMLQKDLLLPWRTVLENALLGVELSGTVTDTARGAAIDMLSRYGLGNQLHAYPHSLSGGQRQRVALTRTLLIEPAILLLDEPFSALDYETRLALEGDVIALSAEQGISVILVTHDIEEAIAMSDRVVILGGRPASVMADIEVTLSIAGTRDGVTAREAPEFRGYHADVWGALRRTGERH